MSAGICQVDNADIGEFKDFLGEWDSEPNGLSQKMQICDMLP